MRPLRILRTAVLGLGLHCGSNSCFVRGTRVRTRDGSLPIESIVPFARVLAFSPERGIVERSVVAVHRSHAREFKTIDCGVAKTCVTPEHPFFVNQQWTPAREVKLGDVLFVLEGEAITKHEVRRVTAEELPTPSIEVFNLTIEEPESTFFADSILVHNKSTFGPICMDAGSTVVPAAHREGTDIVVVFSSLGTTIDEHPRLTGGTIVREVREPKRTELTITPEPGQTTMELDLTLRCGVAGIGFAGFLIHLGDGGLDAPYVTLDDQT